jgi:hypothetical protein
MLKTLAAIAIVSLLPSVASAQTPPPDCTILPQPSSPCAMSGRRAATIRLARVGVEVILAALLGGAVGATGAYVGLNVDLANGNESGVGLALGASFGVALGVAPGVWLGGLAMGGDGSFGWTLLGAAGGTAISAAILAVDSKPGLLFLGATIPIASAILTYELSSHTKKPSKAATPSATGKILPAVSPSFVGVAGTF